MWVKCEKRGKSIILKETPPFPKWALPQASEEAPEIVPEEELDTELESKQEGPEDKQLKMPPKETTCPSAEKALALEIPDKGIQLSDVAQDREALRELMGHSNKYVRDAATFLYRESSWLTDELLEVLTEGLDKKTVLPRLNMYEALQGHSVGCAHPKDTSLENEAAWREYFK